MKKAKTVEAYITSAPLKVRAKLRQMRAAIRSAAPKAEEKISYGMPSYRYKGSLAYFAHAKAHLGLYIPPPVIQEHKREVMAYSTARATVRFPLTKKLPVGLIKKLVKDRVRRNEARHL